MLGRPPLPLKFSILGGREFRELNFLKEIAHGEIMQLRADQQTLATMQNKLADKAHTAVGAMGEQTAAALLRESGYEVSTTLPGQRRGDLRAIDPTTGETWRVEVKTARRDKSGRWKWSLRKPGHTDIGDADIVLLLAVLKSGRVVVFVVPTGAFADLKTFQLRNHPEDYAGRFAVYRCKGQRINLEKVS